LAGAIAAPEASTVSRRSSAGGTQADASSPGYESDAAGGLG
jgi:hypothetical protein